MDDEFIWPMCAYGRLSFQDANKFKTPSFPFDWTKAVWRRDILPSERAKCNTRHCVLIIIIKIGCDEIKGINVRINCELKELTNY